MMTLAQCGPADKSNGCYAGGGGGGIRNSASQRHMAESNSHLLHRRCFARTAHTKLQLEVRSQASQLDLTCRTAVY
jgi:hypothetical protein